MQQKQSHKYNLAFKNKNYNFLLLISIFKIKQNNVRPMNGCSKQSFSDLGMLNLLMVVWF